MYFNFRVLIGLRRHIEFGFPRFYASCVSAFRKANCSRCSNIFSLTVIRVEHLNIKHVLIKSETMVYEQLILKNMVIE